MRRVAHFAACLLAFAVASTSTASAEPWPAGGLDAGYVGWGTRTHSIQIQLSTIDQRALVASGVQNGAWAIGTGPDRVRVWPPAGLDVEALGFGLVRSVGTPDGALFVTMAREGAGPGDPGEMRLIRVGPDGQPSPGWGALGILLEPLDQQLLADTEGGVFLLQGRELQHFSAAGVASARVAPVPEGSGSILLAVPVENGGVAVTWVQTPAAGVAELYLQRLDDRLQPRWGPLGIGARVWQGESLAAHALAFDAGELYISLIQRNPELLRLQIIQSNGLPRKAWPENGINLGTAPRGVETRIAPDGVRGAFVTWSDKGVLEPIHVSAAARVWRPWEMRPFQVNGPHHVSVPSVHALAPDRAGGAYLQWEAGSHAYVLRLVGGAEVAPGWDPSGMRLNLTPMELARMQLVPDGAGGAYSTFEEVVRSPPVPGERHYSKYLLVQRILKDGPAPDLAQVIGATSTSELADLAWMTPLPAGARVTVERRGAGGEWAPVAMRAADADGRVRYHETNPDPGVQVGWRLVWPRFGHDIASGETFLDVPLPQAIRFRVLHNPTPGAVDVEFDLPRPTTLSLDLFDLAGRRVASRNTSAYAPGRHAIPLAPPGLSPGVYVVRLNEASASLTRRIVVLP